MATGHEENTFLNRSGHVLLILIAVLFSGFTSAETGDLALKRKAGAPAGFPVAVFPHWIHRINYRCDACHTRYFEMKAGTAEISMADIKAGKACGACHDGERAFAVSFTNCNRCHVPEPTE